MIAIYYNQEMKVFQGDLANVAAKTKSMVRSSEWNLADSQVTSASFPAVSVGHPENNTFYYLEKYLLYLSIQKTFYLNMKKEALPVASKFCSRA